MNLIYLYCVTDKIPQLKEERDRIYFLRHKGLYAIVRKVPEDEFSEEKLQKNFNNMEWLKIKAYIHEKIIEGVMKDSSSVVPFRLATLFKNEKSLTEMLEKHSEELRRNLKDLEEMEEWGVKGYCDIERLKYLFEIEDMEILDTDKKINSSSAGKAFFLRKKREELLNEVINKKINEVSQECLDRLGQHCLRIRLNRLLPEEATGRKDEMILNSAFLVKKNKVNTFIKVVETFKTQSGNRGFCFEYTGPWPPYNFCWQNDKSQTDHG